MRITGWIRTASWSRLRHTGSRLPFLIAGGPLAALAQEHGYDHFRSFQVSLQLSPDAIFDGPAGGVRCWLGHLFKVCSHFGRGVSHQRRRGRSVNSATSRFFG